MAIPNPPVTPNTSKLHYLLYDATGTNTAALWHSVAEITVNGEVVGVAHVGTHIGGATSGGTDAVVLVAGFDSTTVLPLQVNANGSVGRLVVDATILNTFQEDSPALDGDALFAIGVVRQDTLATSTSADGDYTWLKVNSDGALYVVQSAAVPVTDNSGSLTVDDGGGSVTVDDGGTSITVDVQGTVTVVDGGGSLTVDGTVGAQQNGPWVLSAAAPTTYIGDVVIANPTITPAQVQIGDGTLQATVRNTGASDSLNVAVVDASGNQITSFSGGTQYTEGTTQASIIGTSLLWEDTSDVVRTVSAATPLPVNIVAGGGTGGTATADDGAFTAAVDLGTPIMGFATSDAVDAGDVGVVGMTTARGLYTNIRDDAGDSCMDGANNALRVNIVAGAGSGGTALTDDATFTIGSTLFTPIGGTFNDSATDPTAGQGAVARITSKRGLHVNLRTAAGTEIGTSGSPIRVDTTGTTTQPVSGTISAAQSGTWNVNQAGTWNITNVSGTVSLPTGAATSANQTTEITSLQLLDDVVATTGVAALTKLYQVGGTDGANARVLSVNSSGHVNIADGGNSITVDNGGTFLVQAAQSGTWNVTNISGTVTLPTGASTSANQTTEITSLQLLDDVVATDGSAALTKLYQVGGTDGTNAQIFSTDTSGRLNVNVVGGPSGGTSSVDDSAFTVAVGSGTPMMGMADEAATDSVDEGDVGVVRMTLDRKLLTRVVGATDANRLDVDASGRITANLATGTNNIGDVDVLTVPAPLSTSGNGTASTALRVTVANDSTGVLTANAGTGAFACNLAILSTAVSVAGTATALPASALANRRRIVIQNRDTATSLYVGSNSPSALTTSNGMEIPPTWSQAFEAGPGVGIYGITTGASVDARIIELS